MIRGVFLALETPRATMPKILGSSRVPYHLRVVVWQCVWGMGYAVWSGRLRPKEKLYAPAEPNA